MGIQTTRTRDPVTKAVAALDLTNADPTLRRLDVVVSEDGGRFLGFYGKKSAAVAVDVQVFKVDSVLNTSLLLEQKLADASTDIIWNPVSEEVAGRDVTVPGAVGGATYRLQFGQAGAACTFTGRGESKGV